MSARTAAMHQPSELTWVGKDRELVFFTVKSSSQAGRVNTVVLDLSNDTTCCDCKAGEREHDCWHQHHIRAAFAAEVARQYVATLTTLAEIAAVGRQARTRIDACCGLWALVSPLDRAIYQECRRAWHERAQQPAPALALAA